MNRRELFGAALAGRLAKPLDQPRVFHITDDGPLIERGWRVYSDDSGDTFDLVVLSDMDVRRGDRIEMKLSPRDSPSRGQIVLHGIVMRTEAFQDVPGRGCRIRVVGDVVRFSAPPLVENWKRRQHGQ